MKPANFIQAEGGLKLIDFGISRCMQMDMTSVIKTNPEGSCNYMSPEALKNETSTNLDSPNYGKNKFKVSLYRFISKFKYNNLINKIMWINNYIFDLNEPLIILLNNSIKFESVTCVNYLFIMTNLILLYL